MKFFALVLVIAQVAVFQSYAQFLAARSPAVLPGILPSPCGCGAPILPVPSPCGCGAPILAAPQVIAAPQVLAPQVLAPSAVSLVPSNSVANNLADTLSLLTVSSLLAESLPYGYPSVVGVPAVSSCGCGGYPYYY